MRKRWGWKEEWKAQVMSWSIINLISKSYFSVPFSSTFYIGMSFKLQFYCKRQNEGTALGSSLAQAWTDGPVRPGLGIWGRAELPLRCARARVCPVSLSVPCQCLSHPMSVPCPCLSHPMSVPHHQEGLPAQSHAVESLTLTHLFPANSRKLITFDTISFFFPHFSPFLIRWNHLTS